MDDARIIEALWALQDLLGEMVSEQRMRRELLQQSVELQKADQENRIQQTQAYKDLCKMLEAKGV